jgi:DinB superfamily
MEDCMTTTESSFEKVRRKMVHARIEFMSQLARFSNAELMQRFSSEEWSPLQLAHHLYITDGLVLEQFQRVQNEDNPSLLDTSQVAPELTRSSETPASLDIVLAGMAARREELFEYLSNLPPEAWQRPLHHAAWGAMKFYQMVNVLPQHDQQHAQQLANIKARLQEHNV